MRYIVLSLLLSIVMGGLYSCSQESGILSENLSDESIKLTKNNELKDTFRLKLNNSFSVIVHIAYADNEIVDLNYQLVPHEAHDKYGALKLANSQSDSIEVHVFNKDISALETQGELFYSITAPTGDTEFICECKSITQDGGINDCQLRRFYKYWIFCDGTWCSACSLLFRLKSQDVINQYDDHSVVILPQNYK